MKVCYSIFRQDVTVRRLPFFGRHRRGVWSPVAPAALLPPQVQLLAKTRRPLPRANFLIWQL